MVSSSACKKLGSHHFVLTEKSWTDWKINDSSRIPNKEEDTGSTTVPNWGDRRGIRQSWLTEAKTPKCKLLSEPALGKEPWNVMPELLELSLDDPELQAPGRPSRRGAGGGGRSPQFCEIEFQELDRVLTINMGENSSVTQQKEGRTI